MSDDAQSGQDVNSASTASSAPTSDVNQSTAPSQPSTPDVNTSSAPSTDTGVKQEGSKSLKDAISEGINKLAGKDPTKAAPTEGEQDPAKQDTSKGKTDGAEEDKVSDEEKNAPKDIHEHPAFKKVTAERTAARKQLKELQAQVEPLKADAGRYRQLDGFLKTNNVPPAEAAEALKMVALAVKDPNEFYKKLTELAKEWGDHLGHNLPADLQADVDNGTISPERAAELAQARGKINIATQQVDQFQEQTQAQRQQQELAHRTNLFTAWSNQTAQTDPDLQKKMPMMVERMKYILETEGDPGSDQKAWERLNRVHKEVTERIRGFVPPKPTITPSPRSQGAPGGPTTAPSTMDEAFSSAFSKIRSKSA